MNRHFLIAASLTVLYVLAPAAQALTTDEVEPQTLKAYAVTLNAHASNFQWQQLWKASRDAGVFRNTSNTYFTAPMAQVPDLVAKVLSGATSVIPFASTRATYRYDVANTVGFARNVAVTAVCVDVDWRTLPEGTDAQDASKMGTVSLLLATPCP